MSVEAWSTSAILNSSAPPAGFPEGMQPADVNNSARQVMADVATLVRQFPWLLLSTGLTLSRTGNLQFQVTGADATAIYTAGRRIRSSGGSTVYGVVTSSSFGSGNTTVNVTNDGAANLPSPLTAVDVSVIDANAYALDSSGKFPSSLLKPIDIVNASGSTGNMTITIPSTFPRYRLEIFVSPASTTTISMRTGTPAIDTGASDYAYSGNSSTTTSVNFNSANASSIPLFQQSVSSTSNGKATATVIIQQSNGSFDTSLYWTGANDYSSGSRESVYGGGGRKSSTTVTALQVLAAAGNLNSQSYIRLWPG